MLHLIIRLIPAPLHRLMLRWLHRLRHYWRSWRKAPITGCNMILTDFQGQVLLVRHSYGPDNWSLPGGGVAHGEDPHAAALRELREELGLELANLREVGMLEGVISASAHTTHIFAAIIDRHPRPDRREVIEARFYPQHSLPEPLGANARRALEYWRDQSNRTS